MSKNSKAGVTGPAGQDKPSLLGLPGGGGVSVLLGTQQDQEQSPDPGRTS